MRKIIICLLLMTMIFVTASASFAARGPIYTGVSKYDMETKEYIQLNAPQVALWVQGVEVKSDVPAFVDSSSSSTLVPIRVISENLNADVDWVEESKEVIIKKDGKTIVLVIGKKTASVGGSEVAMPNDVAATLAISNGVVRTMVPLRFVAEQLGMNVTWVDSTYTADIQYPKTYTSYSDILIVIDPGHGGKDPGAGTAGVNEKTVNLDTAKRLKELLEQTGFKVSMVREDDTYLDNFQRAKFANRHMADIYMSIHHNSATNKSANGVLTLYDGTAPNKKKFGDIVQKHLVKSLGMRDAGIINKNTYIVTRETNMTSALAELGFISNDGDRAMIDTEEFRQKCAQALHDAIIEYSDSDILNK